MYRFTPPGRLELAVEPANVIHKFALNTVVNILRYPLRLHRFEQAARNLFSDTREDVPFWRRIADAYEQQVICNEKALAAVPRTGPLVIVANHPLNGVEGLAIGAALQRYRQDVKIALTPLLGGVPGINDHAFFLNPYGGPVAIQQNLAVRDSIKQFVVDGGALIMFPSGEVSSKVKLSDKLAVDGIWKAGTAKLVKASPEVKVVNVFVGGVTSQAFQIVRRIQNLTTNATWQIAVGLPMHTREIGARLGMPVELTFGPVLSGAQLSQTFENPMQMMARLREITYALGDDVDVGAKYAEFLA